MAALPADIVRATRQARVVTHEDTAIKAQFPDARDGTDSPDPGYFENAADASAALALKAALNGSYRDRFLVSVADEVWIDPLSGVPTVRVICPELAADLPALVTRVEVDMESETTKLETLG